MRDLTHRNERPVGPPPAVPPPPPARQHGQLVNCEFPHANQEHTALPFARVPVVDEWVQWEGDWWRVVRVVWKAPEVDWFRDGWVPMLITQRVEL